MPAWKNVKIDGVHDFFQLGYKIWQDSNYNAVIPAGIICVILLFLLLKYRAEIAVKIKSLPQYPQHVFIGLFAVNLLLALILDLDIIESMSLWILEELLELNSAIALCFCVFSLSTKE